MKSLRTAVPLRAWFEGMKGCLMVVVPAALGSSRWAQRLRPIAKPVARYAASALGAIALWPATCASAGEVFSLPALEALAIKGNAAIRAAQSDVSAARGAVQSAQAYPNPEVEYQAGSTQYRPLPTAGVSGFGASYGISQPLDLPFRRNPRIDAAKSGLAAREAGFRAFQLEWIAELRRAYFDALRRRAERTNAEESLKLVQALYNGIKLRLQVGEAARLELIRAEADLLAVQAQARSAALRQEQSLLRLRKLVSPDLPADFEVAGALDAPLNVPVIEELEAQALAANPELERARALREQARYRLNYEEANRLPSVSLRAMREADQELRTFRVGLNVSIPLWDRRKGPIAEAQADVSRAADSYEAQSFAIKQDLQFAYRQYEVTQAQVAALEKGLVAQAVSAVEIAETAYRAGERGLIDVLDAQRVLRSARADLIASRYELASAWVEIQRLVAAARQDQP